MMFWNYKLEGPLFPPSWVRVIKANNNTVWKVLQETSVVGTYGFSLPGPQVAWIPGP